MLMCFIAATETLSDESMDQILRFIAGLRARLIIDKEETRSLEELLFENK